MVGNFDFQNDFQNDAARKNYDAAMNGEIRKGVDSFEKPYLWEEEKPCDIKDTPINSFVPIPVISPDDGFATYSVWKKVLVIAGITVAAIIVGVCAVTYFMDGGGSFIGFGRYFW